MLIRKYARLYCLAENNEDKLDILLRLLEIEPSLEEVFGVKYEDFQDFDVFDIYDWVEENDQHIKDIFKEL